MNWWLRTQSALPAPPAATEEAFKIAFNFNDLLRLKAPRAELAAAI